MKKIYITTSPNQTRALAVRLASEVLQKGPGKTAMVFGLIGELGAGKTTFTQGFAAGLNIDELITSPTYVIVKRFKIDNSWFKDFYHIDCYRIKDESEITDLGFADINHEPKNLILIEWADRAKSILPANTCWIKMEYLGENRRKIVMEN